MRALAIPRPLSLVETRFFTFHPFSHKIIQAKNNSAVSVLNPVLAFLFCIFPNVLPGKQIVPHGKSLRLPSHLYSPKKHMYACSFSVCSLFFPFSIRRVILGNYPRCLFHCGFHPAHLLSPFYKGSIPIFHKITGGSHSLFPSTSRPSISRYYIT